MTPDATQSARIAIACGGTGGHLFPGLAVADRLRSRGCRVTLMVSPKEVDQQAVKSAAGVDIVTLPAIGFSRGRAMAFVRGFIQSYRAAKKYFLAQRPQAVLAMGGFTSAPPVIAGRRLGARTYLHESNTIPGRANRWLSWIVDRAFVGFPEATSRLHTRCVSCTGTPVRPQFLSPDTAECRRRLGFDPDQPVLLIMGGSQGASGINELVLKTLPLLANATPGLQLIHLAGPKDADKVREACADAGLRAVVHAFFDRMELALGAATAAISRAGASSLAELAATRVPAVLVPFPAATDNHQFHNARAFAVTGAARVLDQNGATPEALVRMVLELISDTTTREKVRSALAMWYRPDAAEQIASEILRSADSSVPAESNPRPAIERGQGNSKRIERQECSAA